VEDWEQFFLEKSRRRFDKDRRSRRRREIGAALTGLLLLAAAVGVAVLY